MSLRALGGAPLAGDILARSAYLDEAGIGNPKHESVVVVAGIIVHTDGQWRELHEHFSTLVERYVPEERREGFIFHAKDIWHGEGVFDRKTWQGGDRREILHALCDTVSKFDLPIVWGHSHRERVMKVLAEDRQTVDSMSVTRVCFMSSFAECALCAERWMKKYGGTELLNLIVETNDQLKKFTKGTFRELRKKSEEGTLSKLVPELPITRIIDAPGFMDKEDAPPLQLADTCAFLLKRYWGGKKDVGDYIAKLMPSMMYAFDQDKLAALVARLKSEDPQLMVSSPTDPKAAGNA